MLIHIPIADVRPLAGLELPAARDLGELVQSIKAHGILEPITVRPARQLYVVQAGRHRGRLGWFMLRPDAARARRYGDVPRFFEQRAAALAALPADVPYEVCHGLKRLAAAMLAKVKTIPVVVVELSDKQVAELRRAA